MFPAHTSHAVVTQVGAFTCFSLLVCEHIPKWPVTLTREAPQGNSMKIGKIAAAKVSLRTHLSQSAQFICRYLLPVHVAAGGSQARVKPSQSHFLFPPSVVTAQVWLQLEAAQRAEPGYAGFKDKNTGRDECQHHRFSSCKEEEEEERNEKVKMEASIMAAVLLALTVLDVTSCVFPSHIGPFLFSFFFSGIVIWLRASESLRRGQSALFPSCLVSFFLVSMRSFVAHGQRRVYLLAWM